MPGLGKTLRSEVTRAMTGQTPCCVKQPPLKLIYHQKKGMSPALLLQKPLQMQLLGGLETLFPLHRPIVTVYA